VSGESGWWSSFFDDTYADVGLVPAGDKALAARDAAADFLVRVLRLKPGDRVFDQCCGVGRLSIPLAQRGVRVIGVDLTPRYIERARQEAASRGVDCEFHVGDGFEFVAPEPCSAAFNWFTSFGYSRDDRVNRKMLVRLFESLSPGGRAALDYVSLPRVLSDFQRCSLTRVDRPGQGEFLLIDEPVLDFRLGVWRSNFTFVHPDGRREVRRVETRAFMPHELVALAEGAGFRDIELHGSVAGEPFERTSPRCILVARRPE
jgi:SAM-dependent methyltransferase